MWWHRYSRLLRPTSATAGNSFEEVSDVIDRLTWYLVLLAAVGFGALKCVVFIREFRFGATLTGHDYVDLANVLIAAVAAAIAVRGLRRDARSKLLGTSPASTSDRLSTPTTLEEVRRLPEMYRKALVCHPILTILLVFVLVALPIGLWILATGRSPARFGLADWMRVGLMELPTVVALVLVVAGYSKSEAP